MKLTIATRRSRLAVWQSEHVADQLRAAHPGIEIALLPMSTSGDRQLDVSLAKVGGKGLFIKELETAMLAGKADLAVHSMKDVPAALPDGFSIGAVLRRHDPRDALIGGRLADLRRGARVGTSSLRRMAQLKVKRGDLDVQPVRGNVDTRLAKLDGGQFDAIVLAAAGLERLEMTDRIAELLEPAVCLPAIGQGAIGVECLQAGAVAELLQPVEHGETRLAVDAERELSRALDASCVSPLAGHAVVDDGEIVLHSVVAHPEGSDLVSAMATGDDPVTVGRQAAERMLRHGARSILEAVSNEH